MIDLQIAVAKVMGWKRGVTFESFDVGPSVDVARVAWIDPKGNPQQDIPPLTLGLMWEAEEMLSQRECDTYRRELVKVFDDIECPSGAKAYLWHLTAEQRAKAFLAVKGITL